MGAERENTENENEAAAILEEERRRIQRINERGNERREAGGELLRGWNGGKDKFRFHQPGNDCGTHTAGVFLSPPPPANALSSFLSLEIVSLVS